MGTEASRRKFKSAILAGSAGISADNGAHESDGSAEEERKNTSSNRSRRMTDERGATAVSSKSSANTRVTRTGTRQSGRESTTKRK